MVYSDEELMEILVRAIRNNLLPHCEENFNLETHLHEICLADHESVQSGYNWLSLVDVICELEDELGVNVPDDDFFSFIKVGDIFSYLKNLLNSKEKARK